MTHSVLPLVGFAALAALLALSFAAVYVATEEPLFATRLAAALARRVALAHRVVRAAALAAVEPTLPAGPVYCERARRWRDPATRRFVAAPALA